MGMLIFMIQLGLFHVEMYPCALKDVSLCMCTMFLSSEQDIR